MAMTEEEILREAGRIRASKRRRMVKSCQRCGKPFEGIAQAKYCSDACRVSAARARAIAELEPAENPIRLEPRLSGESIRDYYLRLGGELTPDAEETLAAMERVQALGIKLNEDSTELIRRMREERTEYLRSL